MYTKMYSPGSPVLSQTLDHQSIGLSSLNQQQNNSQCLKFKYFITFLICTTCLALLSASLATHKWIVSKPMRFLPRLNNGGSHTSTATNLTSLMLTAQNNHYQDQPQSRPSTPFNLPLFSSILSSSHHQPNSFNNFDIASIINSASGSSQSTHSSQNNKFQGEIYFGLFKGVKVLNYGFGDRISSLSSKYTNSRLYSMINFNSREHEHEHKHARIQAIQTKEWRRKIINVRVNQYNANTSKASLLHLLLLLLLLMKVLFCITIFHF